VRFSRAVSRAAVAASLVSAGLVTAVVASPAVGAASAVNYVALGDSYSSGLGAGNYISSSGSCDRSNNAYSVQWASGHSPASFAFVACAGATTADVRSSQLSALSSSTTLVSITIGGNDAGFSSVMETCVLQSTSSCVNAVNNAEAYVANTLPGNLDATLRAIRNAAPNAKVVVLDYPQLYDLSKSSTCIGLSTTDRTKLNEAADKLDGALSTAAIKANDTFADVKGQFSTHEICDGSASWLHSVNIFDISESYHPTAAGQGAGYLQAFIRNTG
jgi:lysophospholipase L1-like esterase